MHLPFTYPSIFSSAAEALLLAARSPSNLAGASPCLRVLDSCLTAAADQWADPRLQAWAAVARAAQGSLKHSSSNEFLHLLSPPIDPARPFQLILDWQSPLTKRGFVFECHALLGKASARAAARTESIPAELLSGLGTLRRAREGKGTRSADWDRVLQVSITSTEQVSSLLETLPIASPAMGFLRCALTVLEWVPVAPPSPAANEAEKAQDAEFSESAQQPDGSFPKKRDSKEVRDTKPPEVVPDIGVRGAAANYASAAEKLGLPHRDRLLVNDLAPITKQLFDLAETGTPKQIASAVFATTSLATGCPDSTCLKLPFDRTKYNIWLELDRGAWAWDFAVYREKELGEPGHSDVEPVYCPLPDFVVRHLTKAKTLNPDASNLGDLIETLGGAVWELDEYRLFLNNLGHPSHPPLRARFARSLAPVVLEVTQSDMTTALSCGFFETSAPGALYYFGPTYQLIAERCTAVFERLSLGPISTQYVRAGRAGCQKILEIEELKAGWERLCADIGLAQKVCRASNGLEETLSSCNALLSLLGSAFVVQTAHRGTRLECLNAGALFAHPDVIIINDKDDEKGRSQPRMVPKTAVVKKILLAAAECHLWASRAQFAMSGKSVHLKVSEPVFVVWRITAGIVSSSCIQTAVLSNYASNYFNSAVNFARSAWVTYLDHFGCDRWLIRSLTGHTRDITRLHGPHIDIPPLVVAARLAKEMNRVGECMFGNLDIAADTTTYPVLEQVHFRRVSEKKVLYGPVPDPKTLLSPPDSETLLEHQLVEQIRSFLVLGKISAPHYVLAALHLVFIDQVPDRDLCIEAVTNKEKVLRQFGNRWGVKWIRNHFVEPSWIPIQPSTKVFLERITGAVPSGPQIIAELCSAVRNSGMTGLPKSPELCWQVITSAAESFRRLTFPPSICAVSDLAVPAPALSELSMRRLSGEELSHTVSTVTPRAGPTRGGKKDEDLQHLVGTLNKFSSTTERLGEKQARAAQCLNGLDDASIVWSPLVGWLSDWVVDELRRTRARHDGCYQISSISTYLSTLTTAQKQLDAQDDPRDWEDTDWSSWVSAINVCCGGIESPEDQKENGLLQERAKDALAALARSLRRRREYVPAFLSALLGVVDKTIYPRGSASSCLIAPKDIDRSSEILWHRHSEYPGNFYLSKIREVVSVAVPVRAADVSSLTTKCLTPGGGLVIERVGYNQHKSSAAIRVVQLSVRDEKIIREHLLKLDEFFGPRELLVRGDGSPAPGVRDLHLSIGWNNALKDATGDPKARPHSVRAATLQEIAWPGWQAQAAQMLAGDLSTFQCREWAQVLEKDWTRLSRAASMAGQADLRSALGNYLAGWPLVYSILASATLADLSPGPGLLNQLDLNPESLRQARSRSSRAGFKNGTNNAFDPWHWIGSRQKIAAARGSMTTKHAEREPIPQLTNSSKPIEVSNSAKLNYLLARCLGLQDSLAIEKACVPLRTALSLEAVIPSKELIEIAVRRGRKAPEPRAMAADLDMAETDAGQDTLKWLLRLEPVDFLSLGQAFVKGNTAYGSSADIRQFWPRICACLPLSLSLEVRIGAKYLTPADLSALSRLLPAARFTAEPRIGERPVIAFFQRGQKNLVVSARLTAVTRVGWLAIEALRIHQ